MTAVLTGARVPAVRRAAYVVVFVALLGACGSGGGSGATRPTVSLPRPSISTPGSTSAPGTTAAPPITARPETPTLPIQATTVATLDPTTPPTDAPITTTTTPPPTTTIPPATTTIPQTTTTRSSTTTSSTSTSTTSTTVAAANKSSGSGTPAWAWIVIIVGLVGLVILVIALILRSRANKQRAASWRERTRGSVADAKVARDLLNGTVGSDDEMHIATVRQQADSTAATLEDLSRSAPTDTSGEAAASVAQSLRSYGFAIEAERLLRDRTTAPTADELAQADATRRGHSQALDSAIARLDAIAGPAEPTGQNPTV